MFVWVFFSSLILVCFNLTPAASVVGKIVSQGRKDAGEEASSEVCSFSEEYCFNFIQLTLIRSGT